MDGSLETTVLHNVCIAVQKILGECKESLKTNPQTLQRAQADISNLITEHL